MSAIIKASHLSEHSNMHHVQHVTSNAEKERRIDWKPSQPIQVNDSGSVEYLCTEWKLQVIKGLFMAIIWIWHWYNSVICKHFQTIYISPKLPKTCFVILPRRIKISIHPCLGPSSFQIKIRTGDKASGKCIHWRQKIKDKRKEAGVGVGAVGGDFFSYFKNSSHPWVSSIFPFHLK